MTLDDALARRFALLNGQLPVEVKGASRNDLPALFCDLGFRRGAEIGVWEGEFTVRFLDAGLEMLAVDPWVAYRDYIDHTRHDLIAGACETARARLSAYPRCQILRAFSRDAANDVLDRSLDFVYIDGNHSFFDAVQDLTLWSKKVRSGGVISGHDYCEFSPKYHIHVVEAVHGFTQAHRITPWYVLGRRKYRRSEVHDRYRSFLWVNP